MKFLAVCLSLLLSTGVVSLAAEVSPCNGAEYDDELRLARISSHEKRVHFISDPGSGALRSCPSPASVCKTNKYLVKGDKVLVGRSEREFVCATFVSGAGKVSWGWLPQSSVETLATDDNPSSSDWAGDWRTREAYITLKPVPDGIEGKGIAYWGSLNPRRVATGYVNVGDMNELARPAGRVLRFNSDCDVSLRHFGHYLVAKNESFCGGLNVTFRGVYVREKRP